MQQQYINISDIFMYICIQKFEKYIMEKYKNIIKQVLLYQKKITNVFKAPYDWFS